MADRRSGGIVRWLSVSKLAFRVCELNARIS